MIRLREPWSPLGSERGAQPPDAARRDGAARDAHADDPDEGARDPPLMSPGRRHHPRAGRDEGQHRDPAQAFVSREQPHPVADARWSVRLPESPERDGLDADRREEPHGGQDVEEDEGRVEAHGFGLLLVPEVGGGRHRCRRGASARWSPDAAGAPPRRVEEGPEIHPDSPRRGHRCAQPWDSGPERTVHLSTCEATVQAPDRSVGGIGRARGVERGGRGGDRALSEPREASGETETPLVVRQAHHERSMRPARRSGR